ncbi:transposase [Polaromonas sp. CG_9.11]|nr:transposase [Polaromonas sp. CG_9.11]
MPADHPLRAICQMVNEALHKMDALFAGMYEAPSKGGRPSISPEKLLRAMLLQVFHSIRSDAPPHGADAVQPAVPLVHRPGHE